MIYGTTDCCKIVGTGRHHHGGGGERIKGFDGINKGVEVLEMLEQAGDVALKVPENYTVTSADVANHPVVAQPAAGLSVCVSMDFLL